MSNIRSTVLDRGLQATKDERKRYLTFVEKEDGRDTIRDGLAETMRSHYDRLDRIAG